MVADFSGYATKHGLKCSDGRTIMPGAFKHSDQQRVPLVWQHQHNETYNVLGHAILENRPDGIYAYGYFNDTESAQNAKKLVKHGDITALSIYANNLQQQGKAVLHGDIREVSLVLSGANPGAFIDNVNLVHSDGSSQELDDEAVIYTDESLVLETEDTPVVQHASTTEKATPVATNKTVQDVLDSFTEEQKNVLYFLVGTAVEEALEQADDDDDLAQSSTTNNDYIQHYSQEDSSMSRNVFEQNATSVANRPTLSHSQLKEIVEDAQKLGSFKESFIAHATDYGIDNIDILFPDAKALATSPEIIGRRQEWVSQVINGTKHSPFSRIKSTAVDLTADEARAKGYVKGSLKKDEIVKLLKRVTTPTTIYKKQKLDRDDIVDITDLDVVAWLKAEMRLMLDEELARAVLIGDGRDSDDEDKIDTDHIRPIAFDADMYAHQVSLGLAGTDTLNATALIEAILRSRTFYKGTGTPTLFTTDAVLTELLLAKDSVGRRFYETEQALAGALRVDKIVTVEVMADTPDILGIIVNLADYTLGADRGGNVSMFDDFDIDYNQYKYLIETRVSGALTKPKSALVLRRAALTVVTPAAPTFNATANTITFPTQAGVEYLLDGVPVAPGSVHQIHETADVVAIATAGYAFAVAANTTWVFYYTAPVATA